METTPELIIFMIVGAVAVLSAVMMLVSENAVHSALFLILNFACVAFFYLMLDAAFLAMVQVAVYAGAIMVLFMFVIMLLGAEKTSPEESPRFPWLNRVAVGLTIIFLLTAGIGIMESEISTTEPEPRAPLVRVVNAAPAAEEIDVFLDGEEIAAGLSIYQESDFVAWETGEYLLAVVANNNEEEPVELSLLQPIPAEGEGQPASVEVAEPVLTLEDNATLTLVVVPLLDGGFGVIPVTQNFTSLGNAKMARLQLVNALPGSEVVDLADITEPGERPYPVITNVAFGTASEIMEKPAHDYRFGIYETGLIDRRFAEVREDLTVADVENVVLLPAAPLESDTSTLVLLVQPVRSGFEGAIPVEVTLSTRNFPAFGGPIMVGRELFTTYMLPFQLIALLLLVAMIGAIVMTRDQIPPPKPRFPRRLATTTDILGDSSQD